MTTHFANAFPRKRLFIDMFVRDISFEDCILDLIDNSVDGFVRSRDINLARSLVDLATTPPEPSTTDGIIEVKYSDREVVIRDNCGGVTRSIAETEMFNFGHATNHAPDHTSLGVYGVGMKRALFKIGRKFHIESKTPTEGFTVTADVDDWAEKDDNLNDWRFPLKLTNGDTDGPGYTEIRITGIREEIKQRLRDVTFQKLVYRLISQAYALFLGRHIRVEINGEDVKPSFIPVGDATGVSLGMKSYKHKGVSVQILAGLAERGERGEWKAESAGWYVACNGRMVVFADKTELTGWSTLLPAFVSKYRGFIGIVFFQSDDPLKLPWTTTKRGINRESEVYLEAKHSMFALSRPVISFLDRMYSSDAPEEKAARKIADTLKALDVKKLSTRSESLFSVELPKSRRKTTVRIQYDADKEAIDKIRRHMNKPTMSANKIGEHTFDYYLQTEDLI